MCTHCVGPRQAVQSTQGVSSPSLRDAVENSTPGQAPPLSNTFGYAFPLANHRTAFGSYGNRLSGEAGGWPDFSASNGSTSTSQAKGKYLY